MDQSLAFDCNWLEADIPRKLLQKDIIRYFTNIRVILEIGNINIEAIDTVKGILQIRIM